MTLYIITKSHYSGDHCHIVGVFDNLENAQKVYDNLYSKLEKMNGIEEILLEMHTIYNNQMNKQIMDLSSICKPSCSD